MFSLCPRCKKLKTRFDLKLRFSLTTREDEATFQITKERFGEFEGKKVCFSCYRRLNREEDSLFMGGMLATLISNMSEAKIPTEEQVKCVGAFLNGYSKAQNA